MPAFRVSPKCAPRLPVTPPVDPGGLDPEEVGMDSIDRLWYRGGFPRSCLAASDEDSRSWRRDFVRTFLERDLPALGVTIPFASDSK